MPPTNKYGTNIRMASLRLQMESSLKETAIPLLRANGFKGSLPHFRRNGERGIDLLTFQFDRNGGGFVIEVARVPANGITTYWGKEIPATKVTAWDVHPDSRYRIKSTDGSGADSWFRFDDGNVEQTVKQLIERLSLAERWWAELA